MSDIGDNLNSNSGLGKGSLREYCEQTSLHGWFYMTTERKFWKVAWTFVSKVLCWCVQYNTKNLLTFPKVGYILNENRTFLQLQLIANVLYLL